MNGFACELAFAAAVADRVGYAKPPEPRASSKAPSRPRR